MFKAMRVSALWVSLWIADKIWRDLWIKHALDASAPRPPHLFGLILTALAIELIIASLVVMAIAVAAAYQPDTYALDACFLRLVVADYIISTLVVVALAYAVSRAAQNRRLFRMEDDGLRGITSTCTMMLATASVAILVPFYRLI